jgi:hypothetical protein
MAGFHFRLELIRQKMKKFTLVAAFDYFPTDFLAFLINQNWYQG